MSDNLEKPCKICHEGHYLELYIHNDWQGTLNCNKCNHEVKRFEREQKVNKVNEICSTCKYFTKPDEDDLNIIGICEYPLPSWLENGYCLDRSELFEEIENCNTWRQKE